MERNNTEKWSANYTSIFCVYAQHVQPLKDERNQETALSEKAPKETEKLGRLHFTLDYNFTQNMVRCLFFPSSVSLYAYL